MNKFNSGETVWVNFPFTKARKCGINCCPTNNSKYRLYVVTGEGDTQTAHEDDIFRSEKEAIEAAKKSMTNFSDVSQFDECFRSASRYIKNTIENMCDNHEYRDAIALEKSWKTVLEKVRII